MIIRNGASKLKQLYLHGKSDQDKKYSRIYIILHNTTTDNCDNLLRNVIFSKSIFSWEIKFQIFTKKIKILRITTFFQHFQYLSIFPALYSLSNLNNEILYIKIRK